MIKDSISLRCILAFNDIPPELGDNGILLRFDVTVTEDGTMIDKDEGEFALFPSIILEVIIDGTTCEVVIWETTTLLAGDTTLLVGDTTLLVGDTRRT